MNTVQATRHEKKRLLDSVAYDLKVKNTLLETCEDWSSFQEILHDIDEAEAMQNRLLSEIYGGRV